MITTLMVLAALLGCTADGPAAVREGIHAARHGGRLCRLVMHRLGMALHLRCVPSARALERQDRLRRELMAFDLYRNSTEHEEYRPS